MKRRFIPLATVLLVACDSATGPEADVGVLGFIQGVTSGDPFITVPTTVRAGEEFSVSVRSFGMDSCWSTDRTEVSMAESTAILSPFDISGRPLPANTGCRNVFVEFDHVATLRFDNPGTAQISVRGRDLANGETIQVETVLAVLE